MKDEREMEGERLKQVFRDNPEEVERFFAEVKALCDKWPLWGFRCNGQPYVIEKN